MALYYAECSLINNGGDLLDTLCYDDFQNSRTSEYDIRDFVPQLGNTRLIATSGGGLSLLVHENVDADFLCTHSVPLTFFRWLLERDVKTTMQNGMEPKHTLQDVLVALGMKFEHLQNRTFFNPVKISTLRLRPQARTIAVLQAQKYDCMDIFRREKGDGIFITAGELEYCSLLEQTELAVRRRINVQDMLDMKWTINDLVALGVRFDDLYHRGAKTTVVLEQLKYQMDISDD